MPDIVGVDALRVAASKVEDAAYELAADVNSDLVSEMIVLAAELTRIADIVSRRTAQTG
ncbi:hypothetical protein LCGC14_0770080 [marine sediment metagenome]|uniref:Uncharacterized protein n=1 Tax=marine sediment metagenome TaxID=412755 RepID=A0A0F9Q2T3_9ZZZZ|tara:strand:+ start:1291 stop:1467 length:177 start_codon:yes stop_codon:yes gene_type:complete